jgi:antitoxin PrlF
MSISTLTSKGQTTIPKDIRKRLNLQPGDRLEFVIDEDGRVLVLSVEDMNRAIRKRGGRR